MCILFLDESLYIYLLNPFVWWCQARFTLSFSDYPANMFITEMNRCGRVLLRLYRQKLYPNIVFKLWSKFWGYSESGEQWLWTLGPRPAIESLLPTCSVTWETCFTSLELCPQRSPLSQGVLTQECGRYISINGLCFEKGHLWGLGTLTGPATGWRHAAAVLPATLGEVPFLPWSFCAGPDPCTVVWRSVCPCWPRSGGKQTNKWASVAVCWGGPVTTRGHLLSVGGVWLEALRNLFCFMLIYRSGFLEVIF